MDDVITITEERPAGGQLAGGGANAGHDCSCGDHEGGAGLGGPDWSQLVGGPLADLSRGRRGQLIMMYLRSQGYALGDLQAAYDAHPQAIERFFSAIDVQALAEDYAEPINQSVRCSIDPAYAAAGGAVVGGLLTYLLFA